MFDDLFAFVGGLICKFSLFIGADRYFSSSCDDPISVAHHCLAVAGGVLLFEEIVRRKNTSDKPNATDSKDEK